MTFMSGTTNERNQLKHRAGFGPIGIEAVVRLHFFPSLYASKLYKKVAYFEGLIRT